MKINNITINGGNSIFTNIQRIKLYQCSTGDSSIVMYIWANSRPEAIRLANKEYKENFENGEYFVFEYDNVIELKEPCAPVILEIHTTL